MGSGLRSLEVDQLARIEPALCAVTENPDAQAVTLDSHDGSLNAASAERGLDVVPEVKVTAA